MIFRAEVHALGSFDLFSAPIDGSAPAVQLNGALVYGGTVRTFQGQEYGVALSPDGTRAIYVADQLADGLDELFSVPVDGSAPAKRLNAPLVPGGGVRFAAISPDSTRVAYTAGQELQGLWRLYLVPIDGSAAPAALDAPECPRGGAFFPQFAGPNGARVLYTAMHASTSPPFDLFSVRSDFIGAPVKLSADPALVRVLGNVDDFVLGPEDSVAYSGDLQQGECSIDGLFGFSLDGPFVSRPLSGGETLPSLRLITPSGRLVYGARPDGFYSAPVDGRAPPILLGSLASGTSDSAPLVLAPDGHTLVYSTTPDLLHAAQADVELSATPLLPVPGPSAVGQFRVDPTSRFLVYVAAQNVAGSNELYRVGLAGDRQALKLSGTLVAGGNVGLGASPYPVFLISADGARVVYAADEDMDGVVELYSAGLDPPGGLVKLNAPLVTGRNVVRFLISPDGQRVVYLADQNVDETFELFSVPIDGSAPAVRLNPPPGPGVDVRDDFAISPDGARAVFRAGLFHGKVELWSVPIGGGTAVRLNPPWTSSKAVDSFAIDAESARVVYLADQITPSQDELFSAPIDGSQPSIRLSAPISSDHFVILFQLAPRGQYVLYQTLLTGASVDTAESFAASDDGSRPVIPVPGPLPGVAVDHRFAPSGDAILYRADVVGDGHLELFVHYLVPAFRRAR